jgi:hypothetical protein
MVDELLHHGYVRAQMDSDENSIFVLARSPSRLSWLAKEGAGGIGRR